jgi:competence protein ComEC
MLLAAALSARPAYRALMIAAAGALLGFGHAAWRAEIRLADGLPAQAEGRDVVITGVVAGLPQARDRGTRFLFEVESAENGAIVPRRILLTWYARASREAAAAPPALAAGQRWKLAARLKSPRGLSNPHGFDFEPWALARGIRATGYVRPQSMEPEALGRHDGLGHALHRWRGELRDGMLANLGDGRLRGVLVALAIGDQDAIAPGDWDTFWRTGVGHLMSISGLHITMLAALAFALAYSAWVRLPPLALRLPARKAAVVAGLAAALAYCLMTGFAVPAQRTFVMLAVVALCVVADRHGSPSRVLALAAVAVLAVDPWAVLSAGFWLSFGAVGAIFAVMSLRTGRAGALRAAALEQVAVTVAMAPMLLALFHEVSLVSPLANAVAIPVVSFVVVPLTLAGAFLGAAPLLDAAHASMLWLMAPLEAMASWPAATLESHAPAPWAVALALAGCAWLLAPRGVPLRMSGALCMAPLFAIAPARPVPGEAWIDVLDVGHGLAVVVRTARHALAYDAGPTWDDGDSGRRIVVPFLRGEGLARLDGLVVSHADDDHAGGAASVAMSRRPPWVLSSLPPGDRLHGLAPRSVACEAGQGWRWDGVAFEVLHPVAGNAPARKENDRSCVLRVATRGGAALLTGDIEARSEAQLVSRIPSALRADVLLVPHHGSRSSSTPAFVAAVAPSHGIVSTGHRNRFGHPHSGVVARYRERGVALHRTDASGALRVVLPAESPAAPRVEPHDRPLRYWSSRRR